MSLYHAIERFLVAYRLAPQRVVLAVSGGIDSTALVAALAEVSPPPFVMSAVHVNHHLRGEESEEDARFVVELCCRFRVPLTIADGTLDPARIREVGVEAAARERRYQLLASEAEKAGADLIFTAHQKNDQAETVLMGLITGRGSSRLAGIAPSNGRIARPLLECTREQTESFLAARGIAARQDSSNGDQRFLRNRVRLEVLPLLQQMNPQIVDALAGTARLAAEEQRLLESWTGDETARTVRRTASGATIEAGDSPAMTSRLVAAELADLKAGRQARSFKTIRRISDSTEGARVTISNDLEAFRGEGLIRLIRRSKPVPPFEVSIGPNQTVRLPAIQASATLTFGDARGAMSSSNDRCVSQRFQCSDADDSTFTIRNRRKGDRFRPLGMKIDKKLKDFLINRKIPRDIRDRIPLLVLNGQLLWVGGVEVSDACRVSDPEGSCFEITVTYDE